MGYDLTWADDPYQKKREAVADAIMSCFDARADVGQATNVIYRAMEAVGGYFRTSSAMMDSLIAEMGAQGMFEGNETMREKLERQNGTITPEEIGRSLERPRWPISPRDPAPPVSVTPLDAAMEKSALELGLEIQGGVHTLMHAHGAGWAQKWIDWIVFLFQAREHGGIVVG